MVKTVQHSVHRFTLYAFYFLFSSSLFLLLFVSQQTEPQPECEGRLKIKGNSNQVTLEVKCGRVFSEEGVWKFISLRISFIGSFPCSFSLFLQIKLGLLSFLIAFVVSNADIEQKLLNWSEMLTITQKSGVLVWPKANTYVGTDMYWRKQQNKTKNNF